MAASTGTQTSAKTPLVWHHACERLAERTTARVHLADVVAGVGEGGEHVEISVMDTQRA